MNLPYEDQPIRLDLPAGPPADQATPERRVCAQCRDRVSITLSKQEQQAVAFPNDAG
jgi:hypothetical protein